MGQLFFTALEKGDHPQMSQFLPVSLEEPKATSPVS